MTSESGSIWICTSATDGRLSEVDLEVICEGRRLAEARESELCALVFGAKAGQLAPILADYGVRTAYILEHKELSTYAPKRMSEILSELIATHLPFLVLFPGTNLGNDLACRISFLIERRLLRNCVDFELSAEGKLRGVRPAYNKRLYGTEELDLTPYLATLLPGVVGAEKAAFPSELRKMPITVSTPSSSIDFREPMWIKGAPHDLDLIDADIIIAAGRGISRAEDLRLIEDLADRLGGTVGVSRPLVDDKWAPFKKQIGQTGRTVRPSLYIACGISGASQHVMGMREAKTIIAINTDSHAPIFEIATLAVEGDLYAIIPELLKRLRSKRGESPDVT